MRTPASSVTMWLLTLVALAATATGLEFTLDRNDWNPSRRSPPCGILLCSVSSKEDNSRTIRNLTVYKMITPGLSDSDSTEPKQLRSLASVSLTHPNLEQVYDGMKINGLLKGRQATLRVELAKQADCRAEYACQLEEEDSQGKEMVTSSTLLQQPDRRISNAHDSSLTSPVLMRLFSVIEELNVKFTLIEKNSERLEDQSFTRFQHIEDKLCQLDSKLSAIDSEAIQEKILNTMTTRIDDQFAKFLNATEIADGTLNQTVTLLTSLNSRNTRFQNDIIESYKNLFVNLTNGMDDIFTRSKNLTETMGSTLISIKDDVDISWKQLESNTNKSVLKTLNTLQGIASELNSTLGSNTESALTEFFMSESCKKNTPVLLHPASTPYPVIYRSEIAGIHTPLLCDTATDGGGWIVIQRRSTGTVNFYRNWASYREGFGTLNSDFWLGNDKIHAITSSGRYELRVELTYQGQSTFALYDRFSIAGEKGNYAIAVESYSGTAGDSLSQHNGQQFSTYDRDNDSRGSANCAATCTGAWWYKACHWSNLNGKWGVDLSKGLVWRSLTGSKSVTFSEMKIRRVD